MITVIQKDNTISINGKLFQVGSYISASNPSGDLVAISVSGQGIVIQAPYNLYQDVNENAFGANASQVVTALNAVLQDSNPSGLIKTTDKITALAEVENFTAAREGEFLAVGNKDGSMVASGYTVESFLKPSTDITVDAVTSNDGIDVPYVIGRPDSGKIYADISIESGAVVRAGSFLAGDYIVLEGSTDDGFETTLQVVDPTQDNTITFPNTSGTVALTSDIPSGEIAVDSVDFDLTSPPSLVDGRLAYDADKDTLVFQSEHGEIAIGETYKPVYNGTGSTISKGTVLKATGVQGERFTVGLFDASSGVDEELYLIGIAQADIPDQTEGVVVSEGYVKHLNTSSYSVGTILYASETAGAFTSTKPSSPNLGIPVAMVTSVDGTNGTIYVRLTQYAHLNELHDLNIVSPTNGHILRYNSSNNTWINSSVLDVSTVNVSGNFTAGFVYATTSIISPSILLTGSSSSITVTGVTGEDLNLSSKGNVTVFLDSDTNETGQKFAVHDPSTTERFSVDDSGVVKINNAYTLPSADGTNGQVLTTNGSGAASWADAGGGGKSSTFTGYLEIKSTSITQVFTGPANGIYAADYTSGNDTATTYNHNGTAPTAGSSTISTYPYYTRGGLIDMHHDCSEISFTARLQDISQNAAGDSFWACVWHLSGGAAESFTSGTWTAAAVGTGTIQSTSTNITLAKVEATASGLSISAGDSLWVTFGWVDQPSSTPDVNINWSLAVFE